MVMIDMRNEQDLIDCCLVLSSNILHLDGTRKNREEIRTSSVSLVVLDQAGAGKCDVAITIGWFPLSCFEIELPEPQEVFFEEY